jgi:hypothetical protein
MHYIYTIEKEIVYTFTVFLILFNLVNLYFIKDLFFYDEMIDYLTNGEIKCSDPHDFVYIMLITTALNLLFVFTTLFARLTKDH